ncbi:MAG: arginine--tRNA ligase [Alphaproteobacteria bacterium]|nr:arginine--tRNA ligase [Alphaproteobacteria bacterium]
MNIFTKLKEDIEDLLKSEIKKGTFEAIEEDLLSRFSVEPPRDASFGDMSTNVCLVLASRFHKKPFEMAEILMEKLKAFPDIESVEKAGAGFLNMRMKPQFWAKQLEEILKEGSAYGESFIGNNEKVNVEFTSANPTGPLHVGHARGAIFGDCLSSLLQKVGYDVTREYYINDAGAQVAKLAKSTYLRYLEALGEKIDEIPEGLYPGEYLKDVGNLIVQEDGEKWKNASEEEYLPYFKKKTIHEMMRLIKTDLELAGIKFDVFSSEKKIAESGQVDKVMKILTDKGLVYEGELPPPKGLKSDEDWEPHKMTIFKSTEFGDEVDRPLKRADGSYTYFTPDIGYQLNKYERGFKKLIMVLGADHAGYVARMKAAVKAVTEGKATIDFELGQMINFSENGVPMKMSKRAGTLVWFRDLLNDVGKDVTRFYMMTRKNDSQLDFDLVKVKEQSKDNPVFYVQYAHARAASVRKKAENFFNTKADEFIKDADLSLLGEEEITLVKRLATWPRQVEMAASVHEPHRLSYFLYDVASDFHSLWNLGRTDETKRFIDEGNVDLTKARIALVLGMMNVIASGLQIFGVTPAEEM